MKLNYFIKQPAKLWASYHRLLRQQGSTSQYQNAYKHANAHRISWALTNAMNRTGSTDWLLSFYSILLTIFILRSLRHHVCKMSYIQTSPQKWSSRSSGNTWSPFHAKQIDIVQYILKIQRVLWNFENFGLYYLKQRLLSPASEVFCSLKRNVVNTSL